MQQILALYDRSSSLSESSLSLARRRARPRPAPTRSGQTRIPGLSQPEIRGGGLYSPLSTAFFTRGSGSLKLGRPKLWRATAQSQSHGGGQGKNHGRSGDGALHDGERALPRRLSRGRGGGDAGALSAATRVFDDVERARPGGSAEAGAAETRVIDDVERRHPAAQPRPGRQRRG